MTAQDYYPFGMLEPGRQYTTTGSTAYRYGFNGKEQDSAIDGTGVDYDYGFRIYDARVSKFLSVDPITKQYPELTPYQFASNSPIAAIDLDGLEAVVSTAPVKYRENKGTKFKYPNKKQPEAFHGYYNKGYNMTIYGTNNVVGFRGNSDDNFDWGQVKARGTNSPGNTFETKYGVAFNPNNLHGTVTPGNRSGQNHFDGLNSVKVGAGDLTLTLKISKSNEVLKQVIGVVFDVGPNTQPGESTPSSNSILKPSGDDRNEFIFLIFPGSHTFLEKQIGVDKKGHLLRSPTNDDINAAFQSFIGSYQKADSQEGLNFARELLQVFETLKNENMVNAWDKADVQKDEEKKAIAQPANDNRNANN